VLYGVKIDIAYDENILKRNMSVLCEGLDISEANAPNIEAFLSMRQDGFACDECVLDSSVAGLFSDKIPAHYDIFLILEASIAGYGHIINALWDSRFNPKKALGILEILNNTRDNPSPRLALIKEGLRFLIRTGIIKTPLLRDIAFKLRPSLHSNLISSEFASHKTFKNLDFLSQHLYDVFTRAILPTLLRNYDRYSMINGVEIRMPFMDYRLVEFVFSLPYAFKLGGGYTKRLIRDSLSDIMPHNIAYRKSKIGFNSPIIDWMRRDRAHNGLREWFLDMAHSSDFLQCNLMQNPKATKQKIIDICEGKEDSFVAGERVWCEINPYIWQKSLRFA